MAKIDVGVQQSGSKQSHPIKQKKSRRHTKTKGPKGGSRPALIS